MAENEVDVERGLVTLIATDRIEIPISSMSGRLKRQKPKIAKEVAEGFNKRYDGDRVYARVKEEDVMKARGMKDGIEKFSEAHPKYGEILQDYIAEERSKREVHLQFGMYEGKRVTADDYRDVMTNLGFTEVEAEKLYPRLMEISRKISRKRDEERSVLIG